MARSLNLFQLFLVGASAFALIALAFGGYHVYILATGGVETPPSADERLGELACENDDNLANLQAPTRIDEEAYDRTGEFISAVDSAPMTDGDGTRITISFNRSAVNQVAALRADRSSPTTRIDGTTVIIEDTAEDPFRLWVDAQTEDGEPVRHELDVCPTNQTSSTT